MTKDNERLVAQLRDAIDAAGGSIGFAEYMNAALYAPGLGYYSARSDQFGEAGDFVTAPESTPAFALPVARQIEEILDSLGGGNLCELGAGSGALAAALLEALAGIGALPDRYLVVEPSTALREHQQARLASLPARLGERIEWRQDVPRGFTGVVLANEVLDAIAASRFRVDTGGIRECRVGWSGDGFRWVEADLERGPVAEHLRAILASLDEPLPAGYVSECAPERQAWVRRIAGRLERGVALVFDYGYGRAEYYHPQRRAGTLRCFHRHRAHDDPLILTGLQDISVHVDFTAIAEAAAESGLSIAGYTTQAEFLVAAGLLEACRDLEPGSRRHAELTAQIKRLTLPGEMGEAVKVLALARGYAGALLGFSGRDLLSRL